MNKPIKLRVVYTLETENGYPAGDRLLKGPTAPRIDRWSWDSREEAEAALEALERHMERDWPKK